MEFLNKKYYYLILFVILISFSVINSQGNSESFNKPKGEACSSNLECESGCCSSDKCSRTSKCRNLVKLVYIIEAVVCLIFIIAGIILLIIKLKSLKRNEEDQINHKIN